MLKHERLVKNALKKTAKALDVPIAFDYSRRRVKAKITIGGKTFVLAMSKTGFSAEEQIENNSKILRKLVEENK